MLCPSTEGAANLLEANEMSEDARRRGLPECPVSGGDVEDQLGFRGFTINSKDDESTDLSTCGIETVWYTQDAPASRVE